MIQNAPIQRLRWIEIKHWTHKNTPYIHDDAINLKHFPRYWPFVLGIQRSPVNSPHKGQWRGALVSSLICPLNKRLSKQSWGWWFERPTHSLWCHCNVDFVDDVYLGDECPCCHNTALYLETKQRNITRPTPQNFNLKIRNGDRLTKCCYLELITNRG